MTLFRRLSLILLIAAFLAPDVALATDSTEQGRGRLLQRLLERRKAAAGNDDDGGAPGAPVNPADLPAGTKIYKDVAYGSDAKQKYDVYAPANARHAPIIIMVHGGGWKRGDKGGGHMVTAKVNYWQPKGFIYISVNYRLYPQVGIPEEAADVATALAQIQRQASSWGGDPSRIVMMGHSAGAHLVAYLSANPALAMQYGAQPWRGTVSLDSAMLNAVEQMSSPTYKFLNEKIYVPVLGSDRNFWVKVSPYHQLTHGSVPLYLVCSNTRKDSCPQAYSFTEKAKTLGGYSAVHEEHMSHGEILGNLGKVQPYTNTVDAFIESVIKN